MTDSTYAGRCDAVAAHEQSVGTRQTTRMVRAFWVLLDDPVWGSPLTAILADGTEAVALFSGEEEARMFCRLRKEEATPTIKQTTVGEIISLLYCPGSAGLVALDPMPYILGRKLSGPSALSRTRFARRFAGVDSMRSRVGASGDAERKRVTRSLTEVG